MWSSQNQTDHTIYAFPKTVNTRECVTYILAIPFLFAHCIVVPVCPVQAWLTRHHQLFTEWVANELNVWLTWVCPPFLLIGMHKSTRRDNLCENLHSALISVRACKSVVGGQCCSIAAQYYNAGNRVSVSHDKSLPALSISLRKSCPVYIPQKCCQLERGWQTPWGCFFWSPQVFHASASHSHQLLVVRNYRSSCEDETYWIT